MSSAEHSRFTRTMQEYSIPLILGVVGAVVWANIDHESYAHFVHFTPLGHDHPFAHYTTIHFLVNDIFMALFFGLASKEIVEAALPGGALNPPSKAVNPLLGTVGGVLGPVGMYFAFTAATGDWSIANGWGIPTATDIALAWLVARIAFGSGHPAVSFLLLLAVADDALGLGIIAIFYPDPAHPVAPEYLGLVALAMAGAYGLKRFGVQSFAIYVLGPGLLSWMGLMVAHLHPALALVPIIPFMPHAEEDAGLYVERRDTLVRQDTLNRFEHFLKLPVDYGLFFFGLANAGVVFSVVGNATWGVFLALLVGKTVGIFGFSFAGHKLGFSLPSGMTYRALLVAGVTAGLGLTVALFVAGVAFTDESLQGAAKMGALLSAFIAPVAIGLARLTKADRLADEGNEGQKRSVEPSVPTASHG